MARAAAALIALVCWSGIGVQFWASFTFRHDDLLLTIWTLLAGLHPLCGLPLIANILLHDVSPVLTALFWLFFVPHGRLRWTVPWWWALFLFVYFLYVLARGQLDGKYPYPFIDVVKLGWAAVMLNAAAIGIAFIAAGFALVWIDRWRMLGSSRGSR